MSTRRSLLLLAATTAVACLLPAAAQHGLFRARPGDANITALLAPLRPDSWRPGPAASTLGSESAKRTLLYAWCGVSQERLANGTGSLNDFIAVIDATWTRPSFGKVLSIVDAPTTGIQPHHASVDSTGKWLGVSGLVSVFLPGDVPDLLLFNTTNPLAPTFVRGLRPRIGGCADEWLQVAPEHGGGYLVSLMCGRDGKPGGGIVRLQGATLENVTELDGGLAPGDPARTTLDTHGIDVDFEAARLVTSDFLYVGSSLIQPDEPLPTPILQSTIRIWSTETWRIIKTLNLGDAAEGILDVRHIPGYKGRFFTTNGLGNLALVDAISGQVTPSVFCFDPNCRRVPGPVITSQVFTSPAGNLRMLISSFPLSQLQLVAIEDGGQRVRLLDVVQFPPGAGGHVVKYDARSSLAAVATYFVDQTGTVVREPSDKTVRLVSVWEDRLVPLKTITFETAVPEKGPSNCHGLSFIEQP